MQQERIRFRGNSRETLKNQISSSKQIQPWDAFLKSCRLKAFIQTIVVKRLKKPSLVNNTVGKLQAQGQLPVHHEHT